MQSANSNNGRQKIAWVTGASSGIGYATAMELAEKGWIVVASARNATELAKLSARSEKLRGTIQSFPLDITDQQAVRDCVERFKNDFGPIDLAILNAGGGHADFAHDFRAFKLQQHLDLNVMGTAYCLESIIPEMVTRQNGHIVLVASIAGYRGLPQSLSYAAAKACVINLAESLKLGLKPHHIKVQVVNPGYVDTPLTRGANYPMPFLISAEHAARSLVKQLNQSRFEISFPWIFALLAKALSALPSRVYFPIMGLFGNNLIQREKNPHKTS